MLSNTPKDCELERAELRDIADKKISALESAALVMEKARVKAAVALAQNVAWESKIDAILALESRVFTLENRVRSSIEMLDSKIVEFDRPLHWIKRNVWTVISIIVANAAITRVMIYFLR